MVPPASPSLATLPTATLAPEALELTLLMPCLDEARTVGACVTTARRFLLRHGIAGEVLVADNGSQDGSVAVAERAGARVVSVAERGYGSALAAGIHAARGRYVVMGDSDGSYDWNNVMPFLQLLRGGHELVMGNRFRGGIEAGAMPFLHRYLGNPVLTAIGRRFFGSECGDFYCGQRGFTRAAALRMDLRTSGMEFALEMLVKAALLGMKVAEVPVVLAPDGRGRRSHLRTWRDGWRSLRFFLLCSPRWLFLLPGLLSLALGLGLGSWLAFAPRAELGLHHDLQTLLYCLVAVSLGFQLVACFLFGKVLAVVSGLHPPGPKLARAMQVVQLEHGLAAGALLVAGGLFGSWRATLGWTPGASGDVDPFEILRATLPAALLLTLGVQVLCSSFYFSLLRLQWHERFARRGGAGG